MNSVENEILSLGLSERAENILWSFDDVPFSFRTSVQQKYTRTPSKVERVPGSFAEEAIAAARKIGEKHGKVTILASGGLDSEVVMRSFLQAGVPFDIVTIDFSSMNTDEMYYLERFCRQEGLSFRKLHIDVERFWENDLERVALKSGSVSPQVCAIFHAIEQIDNYVVLGDGEIDIFQEAGRFYETWGEKWAYAPWLLRIGHPGCPSFFSYTAELEASMYLDPMVEDFVNEGWAFLDHSRYQYAKPFLYYHHFGCRFRPKIDVFQPLQDLDDQWRETLLAKMPGADSYFSIELNLLKKIKAGEAYSGQIEQIHTFIKGFAEPQGSGRHLLLRVNKNVHPGDNPISK